MTTTPVMTITDEQIAEIEADGCYPTADEFRALISRLRAAEKDAERYRWIRVGDLSLLDPYQDENGELPALDLFDQAIDSAMEQSK